MMNLGEYIKARRKELGYSAEQIADYCGVAPSTVYRWENGDTEKIPAGQLKKLAEILLVRPSELIDDEHIAVHLPSPESVRTIPIYGDISCGNGLFVEDNIVDFVTVPTAMLPNRSAEYFAQYASGDSMEGAGIYDGDLVIFKKTQAIDNGQIGCFCIDDNVATCKKYSQIGGQIFLLPMNDKYSPIPVEPENECFRIVGVKVLQIGR